MTSSRRSCSKSTSMSGGSSRSADTKREKSRSCFIGSTEVTPSRKQTIELAADPRPWQRIGGFCDAGETDEIVDGQEVIDIAPSADQPEFVADELAYPGFQRRPIAFLCRRLHQMMEIVERLPSRRNRLMRIFVAQVVETEVDAAEQLHTLLRLPSGFARRVASFRQVPSDSVRHCRGVACLPSGR